MNPIGVIFIILAVACFIMVYKGTGDNVIAAIIGHQYGNSALA